jgi:hypothetical protein
LSSRDCGLSALSSFFLEHLLPFFIYALFCIRHFAFISLEELEMLWKQA